MFEGTGVDRLVILEVIPQSKRQRCSSGNGEPAEQGYRRMKVEVEGAETRDRNGPFWLRVRLPRASDAQRDRLQHGIRRDQIENGRQEAKGMSQLEVDLEVFELENLRREEARCKSLNDGMFPEMILNLN
jgi:hypothetical protein